MVGKGWQSILAVSMLITLAMLFTACADQGINEPMLTNSEAAVRRIKVYESPT